MLTRVSYGELALSAIAIAPSAVVAAGSADESLGRRCEWPDTSPVITGNDMIKDSAGRYASVNGLQLYYEVHGAGEPLILLHGGVGGSAMFDSLLPMFAKGRQVITVDLQAHGHTADVDRLLSFEHMANDIAALMKQIGIARADLLGYSLGGGVALRTVIQHPEASTTARAHLYTLQTGRMVPGGPGRHGADGP